MEGINQALLITLSAVAMTHGKPYCYPTQDHIRTLLRTYHRISISARTLNRHLLILEEARFFDRKRRHRRGSDGKMIFNSTLYRFRRKLFDFMGKAHNLALRFAKAFHLPNLAVNQGTTRQGFGGENPAKGFFSTKVDEEGRASRLSSAQSGENEVSLLRDILRKAAFGS